jgi:hypothetical protein
MGLWCAVNELVPTAFVAANFFDLQHFIPYGMSQ